MIKIARVTVDPTRLDEYKAILKEEMETSLRDEPGVYVLYAMWDNEQTNEFTVLEIFKDQEAYDSHCQSPQILKYFAETETIVQNVTITDCSPLIEGIWMKKGIDVSGYSPSHFKKRV